MDKQKILCLGNEFIKKDSLAKEISQDLKQKLKKFEMINIKDSFELLDYINDELIILDVVDKLDRVMEISKKDLRENKITNSHDFDSGFFLQLLDMDVRIIGLPQTGEKEEIKQEVIKLLQPVNF